MIQLPWTTHTVPHCVLELTQQCNLSCKACYRQKHDSYKSFHNIQEEVSIIETHQKIQTISLAGGEPTLHPDLCQFVRYIHERGHKVSLVTNGLNLTDTLLGALKQAGLDIVMIHVDEGQERPDLPQNATIEDLNTLRKDLAAKVSRHNIDAGLCVTIYEDSFANIPALVECILSVPYINFLFATHAVVIPELVNRAGNPGECRLAKTCNSDVFQVMKAQFGLECFAYIPPKTDDTNERPCITYTVPVLYKNNTYSYIPLQSGVVDQYLIRLSRYAAGRYMYYCKNSLAITAIQILVNGLSRLKIRTSLMYLLKALSPGSASRTKRLVFENAPVITANGTINCCDFCPNSTVRGGKIVPVCLADHVDHL